MLERLLASKEVQEMQRAQQKVIDNKFNEFRNLIKNGFKSNVISISSSSNHFDRKLALKALAFEKTEEEKQKMLLELDLL